MLDSTRKWFRFLVLAAAVTAAACGDNVVTATGDAGPGDAPAADAAEPGQLRSQAAIVSGAGRVQAGAITIDVEVGAPAPAALEVTP